MRMLRAILLAFFALATICRADGPAFDFPRPDRAEVMSVEPGATEGPKADLSAAKARKVLKLLQNFKWLGRSGECDKLQYIIRFYAKDKLVATEGLCFYCGCVIELGAKSGDPVSFDLQQANAKALETYLGAFFPTGK